MYTRFGVQDGQIIKLRAVILDDNGDFLDSDSLPSVYIYSPDTDWDVIESEFESQSFDSAVEGPLAPTRISAGFYELEYTVPAGSAEGTWVDLWVGSKNLTDFYSLLTFKVINGGVIKVQKLLNNELIIIELDKSIASYVGETLAADTQLSFVTVLKPYYASPDLVRMEIGPWIDFIPDATLATMIHWSSKEADFIRCGPKSTKDRLQFARAKFVIFDAVLRSLYLPGAFSYQPGGVLGTTKRLGDLSITNGNGAVIARTASGIDTQTLGYIKQQRDEWFRVVNAGGGITPGQSFDIQGAVKGKYNPDRRVPGRRWADPDTVYYEQGGVNKKGYVEPGRMGKFYWKPTQLGNDFIGEP